MPVYYFVIEEDDVWRIRVRGRTYGGYLTRDHALRQAIAAARKSSDEAYVVTQQTAPGYRIAWSNRAPEMPPSEDSAAEPAAVSAASAIRTQMQRVSPGSRMGERMAACRRLPYRRRMSVPRDLLQTTPDPVATGPDELP